MVFWCRINIVNPPIDVARGYIRWSSLAGQIISVLFFSAYGYAHSNSSSSTAAQIKKGLRVANGAHIVKLVSRDHWLTADDRRVFETKDGGKSWNTIYEIKHRTSKMFEIMTVSFVTPESGFLTVGGRKGISYNSHGYPSSGQLLKTVDAGGHWTNVGPIGPKSTDTFFTSCCFVDQHNGCCAGH